MSNDYATGGYIPGDTPFKFAYNPALDGYIVPKSVVEKLGLGALKKLIEEENGD